MVLIRVFKTKKEAEMAKYILEQAGIIVVIEHDKLYDVPIEKYGVNARYKVMIDRGDLEKAAKYLANKLDKKNKSRKS